MVGAGGREPGVIRFPEGFLWGAATSAYQVEGRPGPCDWADWERQPGRIADGSRSGEAAGWWAGKAEDDLAWAADHGHNAHRLGLAWSRLEPEPGRWDRAAFARYAAILDFAGRLGLHRMVTLHHFTLPRWAAARGGWTWPGLPEALGRLAAEVARRLGDRVDSWCTVNEPNVLAVAAYGSAHFPPGRDSAWAAFRAMRHLLLGHLAAWTALHDALPGARAGLVLNLPRFEPARKHPLDRLVAWLHDYVFNEVFVEAIRSGRLLPPLAALPRAVPGLAGASDFVGLNYYGLMRVRFGVGGPYLVGRHVQEPSVRTATNDWGQPSPGGFAAQVRRLAALGRPVIVTENGVMDAEDRIRPRFLVQHLRALAGAVEQGADVRGYFHWSLVDNFEWAEGWTPRFGLLALDRATGRREPRPSAAIFEAIARANGLPDDILAAWGEGPILAGAQ